MSDDETGYFWVSERDELVGIGTLGKEPGRYLGIPFGGHCAGNDSIGVIFGHCLDVEDKHSLGLSIVVGIFYKLAVAQTVGGIVVLCPPSLDVPVIGGGRELGSYEINGEARPRKCCAYTNMVKVFVDVEPLKGG